MKAVKCKCVKGTDGFTWGNIYDVEFAGRVWWAVNDNGKRVCGASESFEQMHPLEKRVATSHPKKNGPIQCVNIGDTSKNSTKKTKFRL